MNLFDAVERFSDQESCIKHLEAVRWGEHPQCPHCESDRVCTKARTRQDRTVELPYLQVKFQCFSRDFVSRNTDSPPEMVYGNHSGSRCEEKHLQSSTFTPLKPEPAVSVAHDETNKV